MVKVIMGAKGAGKTKHLIEAINKAVETETGSIVCRELLEGAKVAVENGGAPEPRSEQYYRKRPCAELVALAADILEGILNK